MRASLAPGQAPVAIHRWFARGEDWAMHPWFIPAMSEVLRLLDDRIKSRTLGAFRIPALGGILVGEILDDRDCLDLRAHGRRPCIVRLLFAPLPLSDSEAERMLIGLRAVTLPPVAGIDQGLIVITGQVWTPDPPRIPQLPPPKPRTSSLWWLLLLVPVLLLPVLVVMFNRHGREATPSPIRPKTTTPPKYVRETGSFAALLRRYSRIDHPYVRYLEQHPEVQTLSPGDEGENYDVWRRRQDHPFSEATHPLPRRLRERVARRRELDGPLSEAAAQMRQLRRRWGDKIDRPTLVEEIEAFFDVVVRPPALPPREEFDHPANVFLWRLPPEPLAQGRTFDTEADLRIELARLAQTLGAGEAGTSMGLLARIESALDYSVWREEQRRRSIPFADETAEPGAAIADGLQRFQSR